MVPVSRNGKVEGAFAWHVSDESGKARINLYRDPDKKTTLAQKRALLAGHRPDPSVVKGIDGNLLTSLPTDLDQAEFAKAETTIGKIIDLDQVELLDQAKGKIKQFRNDITPYSLGVMADVRGGGLKQDLSSMFEWAPPSPTRCRPNSPARSCISQPMESQAFRILTGVRWPVIITLSEVSPNPTPPRLLPLTNPLISNVQVPTTYNPAPVIAKVDTRFRPGGQTNNRYLLAGRRERYF